ncbi:MAG: threonylcarbamoyl-AMP synthase [Bacteroidetes bacterium]|nr:MAG: threonylcarbamoyl-AMP synthase [Bacteroidota bacterium]
MFIKIYDKNPDMNQIRKIVDLLKNGSLVIIPTDSVYGIACDINSRKAVENMANLKGIKLKDADFSFIFHELSSVSEYTKPMSNHIFKVIKKNLPGPFTFILDANNNIPNFFRKSKKTIGVRIPDNEIVMTIVKELGNPILSTSVHADDEVREYMTDPSLIYEKYNKVVEAVIDGGYGKIEASTIADCTGDVIEILREGIEPLRY